MTAEQKALEAEIKQRLRDRAALLLSTDQDVIKLLQAAKAAIMEKLAAQPSEFAQWQLPQLLSQIQALLDGATSSGAARVDAGLRDAWQRGEDFVDKPLAAAGFNVEAQLPLLDATVLGNLRTFTVGRIKDIGTEAVAKMTSSLGLVTLGAKTPFEAIKDIQVILGQESTRRATTIVRTELGRAFAMASQQRMEQSAEKVPGLQKQWRRSGKIHSRWNHDAVDGQIRDVAKPFDLPSPHGVVKMMCPHDPAAPASEVISCGCISIPYMAKWANNVLVRPPEAPTLIYPGAKPYTALELKLDHRKAMLDQAAKRAGLRKS